MALREVTSEERTNRSRPSAVSISSASTATDCGQIETLSEDIDRDLSWLIAYNFEGWSLRAELLHSIEWGIHNRLLPIVSGPFKDATVPVALDPFPEPAPAERHRPQPPRWPLFGAIDSIIATRKKGVSGAAISDAITFIAQLPASAPMPVVSANEDGELVLEWALNGKEAVAGFDGDGHFGYTMLIGGRFRPGQEEGSIERRLPRDLILYLGISTED